MVQRKVSQSPSSRHHEDLPPVPQTALSSVPSITASFYHSESAFATLDQSNKNLNPSTNPLSPMSISSAGSLPSPLFDKDIFEAFPSVPDNTPSTLRIGQTLPLRREQSLTAAAAVTANFDSALLSSAIHLASRNTAHTSAPSAPTSSRRPVTPTQLSLRSGESSAI